ncbi:MAG: adenosine kinase [Paracoccaceae bacterium]|jgi:sugar/nucleoside kinase (ribokinase family)|nr:MAG: carbohydrate kinase [Rhodobacter sp. BACL10 MAG-120419-bin15]MDP5322446.1 adenosine kinase [Paracoccaceae bacterium]HAG26107.1 adenosine kinase [Rhodobacter sp.]MDP5333050.1 adenosine kinase [Paracoccaceae bacterium]MDP5351092.1 adenosine kinase [Paracoccaceae bacterium]
MKKYQVIGIGNAMVDVLSYADDAMLARHDITKGVMQLIDMPRAVALYSHIGSAQEVSGGSAANSIAAIAHLGGRTAYVGKVCDDQLGAIFAHDLRAQGAVYETKMAPMDGAQETGRCIVLVTPDGERTLNTYLGWSEFLTADDIITDDMAQAEWIYLEGYRFDGPESHAAFSKAIAACKGASGKVSITLSDPFCVERHRAAFLAMIRADADLLFANHAEMVSLYQTETLEEALAHAAQDVEIVACTDGANGAFVIANGQRWHIDAIPTQIKDATGAGDLFAGAFLWAITNGHSYETAGKMGCIAAAEVISHIGARPQQSLRDLFVTHRVL